MRRRFAIPCFAIVLWLGDSLAQTASTSPPPANIVFVPHPHAHRLARHPTLPVLYLGLACEPESKNLATLRLDTGDTVLTNSLRAFDDFFTDNGKNPSNLYSILTPIVLPKEKVLLLAAQPASYPLYDANSNAQHLAAIALDEQGQPVKMLRAFRTTHTEASIVTTVFEPATRRLYVSYSTYWGWVTVGHDGVPSREFHMMALPWNLWEFVTVPAWGRLCGLARGTDLYSFRLAEEGNTIEFFQMSVSGENFASLQLSPTLGKAYALNGPDFKTITVFSFTKEGRFASVPRRFRIGEAAFLRLDSKSRHLYCVTQEGAIRVQPLSAEGFPSGRLELFRASCGTIRDVMVDESTGKVYVACTEAPK